MNETSDIVCNVDNVVSLVPRLETSRRRDPHSVDDDLGMRALAADFFMMLHKGGVDYSELGELLQRVGSRAPTETHVCELARLFVNACRRPQNGGAVGYGVTDHRHLRIRRR